MEKKPQKPQAEHTDSAIDDKVAGGGSPAIVVGIGAGAGSLKSLKTILGGLPSGRGIAVILIHHPELTKKNLLKLLKGQTPLEVVEAADGMAVLADHIYVMPPDKFLNIAQDRLTLTAPVHCDGLLMPIDHFFCSLAADRRKRCCGILLVGRRRRRHPGALGDQGRGRQDDRRGPEERQVPRYAATRHRRGRGGCGSPGRCHRRGRRRTGRAGDRSDPERNGGLAGNGFRPQGHPGYPARPGRSRLSLLQARHPPAADPPADDAGQDCNDGRLRPAPVRSSRRGRPAAEGPAHRRDGLLPPASGLGDPGESGHRAARGKRRAGVGDPGLGSRLFHGKGGLQPGHTAGRGSGEERREDELSDLRHRRRFRRAGKGPHRQLSGGRVSARTSRPSGSSGSFPAGTVAIRSSRASASGSFSPRRTSPPIRPSPGWT